MIAECADACARAGVPATFFVTHDSPIIRSLASERSFELGLHPYFGSDSTQGKTLQDALAFLLDIVPDARALRTHKLVQSSPLIAEICATAPQIDVDVSLYLHRHSGLQPVVWRLDRAAKPLWRLPYFWEDDFAAADPDWSWSDSAPESDGLRIFDFHPILLALNVQDLTEYSGLKARLGRRPLTEASRELVTEFRRSGIGDASFFHRLLGQARDFVTVSALAPSQLAIKDSACV